MELVPILFIWLIGTILAGVIADKKERSVFGWVVLSLFISPLIAIIIVAVIGESHETRIKRIVEEEKIREAIRKGEDISKMNFSDNVLVTNHSGEVAKSQGNTSSDNKILYIIATIVVSLALIRILAFIIFAK